ncbi:XshC-Cox1 family protein [Streptomyces sp. SID8358]|uniref:XdhC family protein n=1 Tax=Streptomyces sp. SID8358 TaxID=2690342 RepID=UPI000DAEC67A|nr:XdhC/CoxI family protein [Streptomyces sp. SID8358]MYU34138.1 XshC-Cox1 family protein [Streptomyces sp. SID8358]
MRHVIQQAAAWQRSGIRFAMATVTRTWGSAPHGPGASMLVSAQGRVAGSVSGGCVEAAVCAMAEEVLTDATPAVGRWGVDDGDALEAGLTCGGTIEVLVREITPAVPLGRIAADLEAGVPVALVTSVARGSALAVGEGSVTGTLGDPRGDRAAVLAAEGLLGRGAGGLVRAGSGEPDCAPEEDLLVQSFAARPRLLVFGATEFARPLAGIGAALGHRVTVCDARPAFALPERFPGADEVVTERPDRWFRQHQDRVDGTTAVCVLTHDARFDVPVLALALGSRAGYVGAMGSRRTHEDRLVRLREAGLADAELARLHSPIGLDLGGRGPEETALSIMAEIVAVRRGGSGLPLTAGSGPVHGV